MDVEPRRRSLKVVHMLCDGCERASATAYCTECKECACNICAEQLHVRGRRTSKRAPARTCKGRSMKDLQKSVAVLALCNSCRVRPACRYGNGELHGLCQECRLAYNHGDVPVGSDVVKRAIVEELRRGSKSGSSTSTASATQASAGSRRRRKHSSSHSHSYGHGHHKSRRDRISSEDDSTGDDITFSRESSAE